MLILLEGAVLCLVFTALIVPFTLKNPTASIGDYPPAIRKRCAELGVFPPPAAAASPKRTCLRKGATALIFALIAAVILRQLNGAERFWEGFRDSYLIWLIVDWYDALVLDCLWFCHCKAVRIPGTEEMAEYRDYRFPPPPVLHRDAARAPRLRGGRGAGGPARNDITVTAAIHFT